MLKTRIKTCVGTHTDPDGNKTYPETYTFVISMVRVQFSYDA